MLRKLIVTPKPQTFGGSMFETDKEVLEWYERQPAHVTGDFIDALDWANVKNYPLNPAFVPVLLYMRDIEFFTDVYHKELLRTPTGKDPVIARFMERWVVEENRHAELLNRFLAEADVPTSPRWQEEARAKIPWQYQVKSYLLDMAVRPFGRYFPAAHMVWGAIYEITTLQGYRRQSKIAKHPVLTDLLSGVIKEESTHANFYWSIARLKLNREKFSQDLARFILRKFWAPVGQGIKPEHETNYVVTTLFRGPTGVELFDRKVVSRIQLLPGFDGFNALTEKVAPLLEV
jgi:hypothetical protein